MGCIGWFVVFCACLPTNARQQEPPKLSTVFEDNFSKDTRASYAIDGRVTWRPGQLTLDHGATVQRSLNGSAWTKLELDLAPPKLTADQTSEVRIWFVMDGATNCYVRLRTSPQSSSVALIDTNEEDGKPVEFVVRQANTPPLGTGTVSLEYRNGLVSVTSGRATVLLAYIDNGSANVVATQLMATTSVQLRRLAVLNLKQRRPYSELEKQQILDAEDANWTLIDLYEAGETAKAIEVGEDVLAVRKSLLGEQHPDYAESLNNLAVLYENTGDHARAETLYRVSTEIRRTALGEQHPEYAASLDNLAVLYTRMGDFARAEPLTRQATAITKTTLGEQHHDYATRLNNLAQILRQTGKYQEAEPLMRKAIDLIESELGKDHPHYAISLNNLAVLCKKMGDYARAERLHRQTLELQGSLLGEQHPDYANSLHNFGMLFEQTGDYGQAEELIRQAVETHKVLGERHPDSAEAAKALAGLCERRGDDEQAEALYQQALTCIRQNLDDSSVVQSERQQKRNQSAERDYLDARLSFALRSETSPAPVLESLWQWKGAVTLRQQAYRQVASSPKLAPLFSSLQSVSRQLSALSGRIPMPPPGSASSAARRAWERDRKLWDGEFARLSRQREDLEQQIAADSDEFRTVHEPLSVASVRAALPPGTAFVDILDYLHTSRAPDGSESTMPQWRFIAFVVRQDREPRMLGLGSVQEIGEAIADFRGPFVGTPTSPEVSAGAAKTLRTQLWLPLEQHLDGIDTVIISPDTVLGTLPFCALPGEEPDSYLIERYSFATLPLAAMLESLFDDKARRIPAKGLLTVGDVAYGSRASGRQRPSPGDRPTWLRAPVDGSHWLPLPSAGDELASIQRTFTRSFEDASVTTLEEAAATEEAFMKQAPRHYNLHVVTHGFFAGPQVQAIGGGAAADSASEAPRRTSLADAPIVNQYVPGLLSGLVLAGANEPPPADQPTADGILTASEIETLDLNAVDLVVLSACDTGLGETAGGEGLTGLQRAFHIAGARSVVASLWAVDDKATQELMSRFYRNYWEKGQPKIHALRNAQLDLLKDASLTRGDPRERKRPAVAADRSSKKRTDPRYWAAFVLSGAWQ